MSSLFDLLARPYLHGTDALALPVDDAPSDLVAEGMSAAKGPLACPHQIRAADIAYYQGCTKTVKRRERQRCEHAKRRR
jgi:hypothetical protein